MVRLNIDQQQEEVRDIEEFLKDLGPISVVELQAQQIKRLIFFAKKGIISFKHYKTRMNPSLNEQVDVSDGEQM